MESQLSSFVVPPGMELARVSISRGEQGRILLNGEEFRAHVAGSLTHADAGTGFPVTGDWVAVRLMEPGRYSIEQIAPRKSKISRKTAGNRADEQVLAANVDVALIISGLDGNLNLRRLERFLAIVHDGNVPPVIVLNKVDLCPDVSAEIARVREVAGSVQVLAVSAKTGVGCAEIEELLGPGKTGVLLGSSGVGKSTLLNRILGREQQATGIVRESDGLGQHTTIGRELIMLPSGGALIDTPGIREIQLLVTQDSINAVFADIVELALECKYRDCTHLIEPDCAVRNTVAPERLQSFLKLSQEASELQTVAAAKQRGKGIQQSVSRSSKKRPRISDAE
ncbi:MAG: ribosome small subunit-dependent GTPase A [Acidobacteriota bacterium]